MEVEVVLYFSLQYFTVRYTFFTLLFYDFTFCYVLFCEVFFCVVMFYDVMSCDVMWCYEIFLKRFQIYKTSIVLKNQQLSHMGLISWSQTQHNAVTFRGRYWPFWDLLGFN